MPRYSDWVTSDPVERAPDWYWWERAPYPENDVISGSGPTYGHPQLTSIRLTMDFDATGNAILRPPSFARTVGSYAAHDVVPAANVIEGGERPADSSQSTDFRIAELHVSDGNEHPFPDVVIPDGATIEWEDQGEWIGDTSITTVWSVRSGYSGGAGSNAAALCRVPANTIAIDDAARTDVTLWAELAAMLDTAPCDVTTLPYPTGDDLNDGDPTSGEYTFNTSDAVVCLAIRTPEQITPIIPDVYPLTIDHITNIFSGPSSWDLYGMGAQIDSISMTRMFQPPRYRLVFPTRGAWRLRQRQSLTGSDSWPLRQRQNGGHSGAWPLRQHQRGV